MILIEIVQKLPDDRSVTYNFGCDEDVNIDEYDLWAAIPSSGDVYKDFADGIGLQDVLIDLCIAVNQNIEDLGILCVRVAYRNENFLVEFQPETLSEEEDESEPDRPYRECG